VAVTVPTSEADMTGDGRALSRVTLTFEVHDGTPRALVDHLQAEAGAVLERWGCDVLGGSAATDVGVVGDDHSAGLPAIGGDR
jgi:hypothetical protein